MVILLPRGRALIAWGAGREGGCLVLEILPIEYRPYLTGAPPTRTVEEGWGGMWVYALWSAAPGCTCNGAPDMLGGRAWKWGTGRERDRWGSLHTAPAMRCEYSHGRRRGHLARGSWAPHHAVRLEEAQCKIILRPKKWGSGYIMARLRDAQNQLQLHQDGSRSVLRLVVRYSRLCCLTD